MIKIAFILIISINCVISQVSEELLKIQNENQQVFCNPNLKIDAIERVTDRVPRATDYYYIIVGDRQWQVLRLEDIGNTSSRIISEKISNDFESMRALLGVKLIDYPECTNLSYSKFFFWSDFRYNPLLSIELYMKGATKLFKFEYDTLHSFIAANAATMIDEDRFMFVVDNTVLFLKCSFTNFNNHQLKQFNFISSRKAFVNEIFVGLNETDSKESIDSMFFKKSGKSLHLLRGQSYYYCLPKGEADPIKEIPGITKYECHKAADNVSKLFGVNCEGSLPFTTTEASSKIFDDKTTESALETIEIEITSTSTELKPKKSNKALIAISITFIILLLLAIGIVIAVLAYLHFKKSDAKREKKSVRLIPRENVEEFRKDNINESNAVSNVPSKASKVASQHESAFQKDINSGSNFDSEFDVTDLKIGKKQ